MLSFEFEGVDKNRTVCRGIVQARTGEEAILKLAQRNIYTISLTTLPATRKIAEKQLKNFKQLKGMLGDPMYQNKLEVKKPRDWGYIIFIIMALLALMLYFLLA